MKIVSAADRARVPVRGVRLLVALLILLASASAVWSQAVVRGAVTDPLGSAVKDARVTLERDSANSAATTTSDDGAFRFASVDAGRYRIRVEAPGFAPYAGPGVLIRPHTTRTIDVVLQITPLKQDMVVSATGSEIPVSQVGASVSLLDGD